MSSKRGFSPGSQAPSGDVPKPVKADKPADTVVLASEPESSRGGFSPAGKHTADSDAPIKVNRLSLTDDWLQGSEDDGKPTAYNFTGVTPGKTYLHPPSRLINGRVIYNCKYVGHLKVKEPRGSGIMHDAIDKLLAVAAVTKANLDQELKVNVQLSISIYSLSTENKLTQEELHNHPLQRISFSADDKRNKGNMFAYICRAVPPDKGFTCYVYQCSATQAKEINATLGQAFELAYKKTLELKQAKEEFRKLKEDLKTAAEEDKTSIQRRLIELSKMLTAEQERVAKEEAAEQERMARQESEGTSC